MESMANGRPILWRAAVVWAIAAFGGCADRGNDGPLTVNGVVGEIGVAPGQFSYPRAIDASMGWMVVIDKTARVQRLDARTGEFLGGFRMPELDLGKPTGVTIGPHPFDAGRQVLYIADTHYHRVMVYDVPSDSREDPRVPREPLLSFGSYGTGDGQFVYLTDVAPLLDEHGAVTRLYVTEYGGNDRISVWDVAEGEIRFSFAFGRFGDGRGVVGSRDVDFQRPQSIEIDHARREIVMTDTCSHRVGRFTLEGELIAWIGDDAGEATFAYPQGLVLLEGGRALVVEFLGNRVQIVDLESGASLGSHGTAGRMVGELASPWGVAINGREVLVLDSGNNRVQRTGISARRLNPPWAFGEARASRSVP